MFKIHPLRCKLSIKEPDFTLFSSHSAAMRLKNRFARTLSGQFSLAKTKFKHALSGNHAMRVQDIFFSGPFIKVVVSLGGLGQGNHLHIHRIGNFNFVV
jgi:beta-lactamase class D